MALSRVDVAAKRLEGKAHVVKARSNRAGHRAVVDRNLSDTYKEGLACVDGFVKGSSTARRPRDAVL